jgi:nucleotide-binding universal stress UspA family protein
MLIAHATDLTGDDEPALVHAAALAAAAGARLVSLHAGPSGAAPDVATLQTRWGRPIDHEFRRVACWDEVVEPLLEAIASLAPSLVVLGTHARHGVAALVRGSVGEAIARNLRVPALIVPDRGIGFVDAASGHLRVRRILVPVEKAAIVAPGVETARWFAGLVRSESPRLDLVHAGPLDARLEELGVIRIAGELEEAIVRAADRLESSLIVMPTRGHDSVGDVVGGSHTEHVIRKAGRPVLVVPS